jgi:hypothetical protein
MCNTGVDSLPVEKIRPDAGPMSWAANEAMRAANERAGPVRFKKKKEETASMIGRNDTL